MLLNDENDNIEIPMNIIIILFKCNVINYM